MRPSANLIWLYLLASTASEAAVSEDDANIDITEPWHDLLFGSGLWSKKDELDFGKHMSSSTEDLVILFRLEKDVLKALSAIKIESLDEGNGDKSLYSNYLKEVDFNLETDTKAYVFHPINAFHLIKRTSVWLPKLRKKILAKFFQHRQDAADLRLPAEADALTGAAHGLATIQDYYNMDALDMVRGIIKDYMTGEVFLAASNLTSSEGLQVANAAKKAEFFDGYVSWCQASLEAARSEERPKKTINMIKKLVKQGKAFHDEVFEEINYKTTFETAVRTNETPFKITEKASRIMADRHERTMKANMNYGNLMKGHVWSNNDLAIRMEHFLRRRSQQLCRGTFERPAVVTKHLKCIHLHHNQPYLKLGPFKLEFLHREPEVALIHDFASDNEIETVKAEARGHMKTTPYLVGKKQESYSKLRTSKIMYMRTDRMPEMMSLSNKIQNATRYNLYSEQYASENYQIMNYGIGGIIGAHVDADGRKTGSTENSSLGGLRLTTFMIYMTSVKAGGHTIFPQAGISVKPVKGSALFWFNSGAQANWDSRILHLGCPVLYGNKWIANKWIKSLPSYKSYPCSVKKLHHSVISEDSS